MFCPNCGTQNQEAATTCSKCGFNLKGAAAPKFKGTMLMMNAPPGVPRPGAGGPAGGPPGAHPPGAGAPPAPERGPVRAALKGTMLGVAPPSAGAQMPPPGGMGAPPGMGPPPAPPPGFGAPPAPPPGMGQPPAAGGPPPPFAPGGPHGAPGFPPPHAGQHADVNPLGGTMVADPAAMAAYSPQGGPPHAASPYGPPPGAPQFGPPGGAGPMPGGPPPGFGAPPHGAPGFGSPPGAPPHGAPGFGPPPGAPPAFGAQQSPYGPPPGPAPSPGMQPGAIMPAGAQPLAHRPAGARGPVGNVRNPIVCLLVGMICAPYMLFVMYSALNEFKAFRGKDDFNPLVVLLLWIVFVWGMPEKVFEAKQMAGVPNPAQPNAILYFLLGPYFFIADLNEIWQAAGGGQPAPAGAAQLPR